MAETLVIRMSQNLAAPVEWITIDDSGARIGPPRQGTIAEAGASAESQKVILLLPAEEILTTHAEVPVKSGKRLLAALPFAMEEQVADDVENLHFAAGKRLADGSTPVAVISRERMHEFLQRAAHAGISPVAVYSEIHGVASIPGTINVMLEGPALLLNDGEKLNLAIRDVALQDVITSLLPTDENSPRPHIVASLDAQSRDELESEISMLQESQDNFEVKVLPDGIFPRLAATAAVNGGINLLQGEFGVSTDYSGMFKPWRIAAILFLALGATWIAQNLLEYYTLARSDQALREQVVAEFKASFPWVKEVRDPEAQLNSLLRQTGTQGAQQVFLASLVELSKAIAASKEASIEAISYRSGVMDVRLSAPSVSVLDSIQKSISAGGQFRASIQSTDQQDGKVMSRIQIQASSV